VETGEWLGRSARGRRVVDEDDALALATSAAAVLEVHDLLAIDIDARRALLLAVAAVAAVREVRIVTGAVVWCACAGSVCGCRRQRGLGRGGLAVLNVLRRVLVDCVGGAGNALARVGA
jgi:hypothetical protein